MKAGDKVRCIDAKERGIPLIEGETYTIKNYSADPSKLIGPIEITERAHIPAVTLVDVKGYFMATRFEVVE